MDMTEPANLPYFLQSWDNLLQHFDEHFPEDGNGRGDTFLVLAQRLIPITEVGRGFPPPALSEKKSHDGGVDLLTAENDRGQKLCVQSKYKVRGKDELDSIISKFESYEASLSQKVIQTNMFDPSEFVPPVYLIITSSKLDGIRRAYLDSSLSSLKFHEKLNREHRLFVVDGPTILTLLQTLYKQSHQLPNDVRLTSTSGWIQEGNVRLGTVRAQDLVDLHAEHGNALFFENIRDFLGLTSGKKQEDRVTVNAKIAETVKEEPARMLERNNGITFRAATTDEGDGGTIVLHQAAIVNGCQTTMCLVNCAPINETCLVQVKIVITPNGWEIATAANYQNPVTLIELDLAKYLRPQLVKKAATDLGYGYETEKDPTVTGVLNAMYRRRVDYEEMRLLYLALFSTKPSNLFDALYTKLLGDVLHRLYAGERNEADVFRTLFQLLTKSREALTRSEQAYDSPEYASTFKRFQQEDKPSYRIYMAVLAACGATRVNLADRATEPQDEANRLTDFLSKLRAVLEQRPSEFVSAYLLAFQVLADAALDATSGEGAEIAQNMFRNVTGASFSTLYQKLLMRIDSTRRMRNMNLD